MSSFDYILRGIRDIQRELREHPELAADVERRCAESDAFLRRARIRSGAPQQVDDPYSRRAMRRRTLDGDD